MEELFNILRSSKGPVIIIPIGLPLSGKSTLSKSIKERFNHINIISRDSILLDMSGIDDYRKAYSIVDHELVDKEYKKKILECSFKKESIYIDMLNLSSKRRKARLATFGKIYTKIAIIFPIISDDEFHIRNNKRTLEENKSFTIDKYEFLKSQFTDIKDDEGFNYIIKL